MRLIRIRAAAFLLSSALMVPVAGCGQPSVPAAAQPVDGPTLVRAQADDAARENKKAEDGKDERGEGFRFPEDKGGQLLAKELPPADRGLAANENVARAPKRLPGVPALEHPTVPLQPNQGQVPRLPAGRKGPPLRPRSLPDALPLSGARPEPPQEPRFHAGDRVRQPGPDPNQPVPLPVLATPARDRTTSDDPTADFSSAAVQAAPMPSRGSPAPAVKLSLPDPFENRNTVRLREPPPEKGEPVSGPPRLPSK